MKTYKHVYLITTKTHFIHVQQASTLFSVWLSVNLDTYNNSIYTNRMLTDFGHRLKIQEFVIILYMFVQNVCNNQVK